MSQDSRFDRSDVIRLVREQASRVYLQTIAANEREDRLLHKKLDALDLEHRAQYLKMKKWIGDTQRYSQLRAKRAESILNRDTNNFDNARAKALKFNPHVSLVANASDGLDNHEHITSDSKPDLQRQNTNTQIFPSLTLERSSTMLHDRVVYTDSECARLKTRFAGKKTPPNLRRARKFLPHLDDSDTQLSIPKRRSKGKRKKSSDPVKQFTKSKTLDSISEKLPQIGLGAPEGVVAKPNSAADIREP